MTYGIKTQREFECAVEALNAVLSATLVVMLPWSYEAYIKSKWWSIRREIYLEFFGGKCTECGLKKKVLQLHHFTYENLRQELPSDCRLICKGCHARTHGKE